MPEKGSPPKKRNPIEGLCVHPLELNYAAVTDGWRSGKDTIMNIVI